MLNKRREFFTTWFVNGGTNLVIFFHFLPQNQDPVRVCMDDLSGQKILSGSLWIAPMNDIRVLPIQANLNSQVKA